MKNIQQDGRSPDDANLREEEQQPRIPQLQKTTVFYPFGTLTIFQLVLCSSL
jgi:hypothetical protein